MRGYPAHLLALTGMFLAMSACGGGGGSSTAPGGGLTLRAVWQQPVAAPASGGARSAPHAQQVADRSFGAQIPPSVKTVRLTFESSDGSRCCVAVSSALPARRLVLTPLPIGEASVTLAGFPSDFAPADGIAERCVTDPVDVGQPCDASQSAATSYLSDPKQVTIASGVVTEAGEIPVYSTPFWLDLAPAPNGSGSNPVTVGFAVVDAAEQIDAASITIEAAGVHVPVANRQVCDDQDGTSLPCSSGGLLGVQGFVVSGAPQVLSGSPVLVRVAARNAGGHAQDFGYQFTLVPGAPTATPGETPTATDTPAHTARPTDTPSVTPTRPQTPTPSLTATVALSPPPTATQSHTPTATATQTSTATQLSTATSTQTVTPTRMPTDTPTPPSTATPTPTATQTPTATPTQTVTTTQTATETPTLTPSVVTLRVGSAAGAPGTTVSFAITLSTAGRQVLGLQHQLAVEPATAGVHIAARVDELGVQVPDCTAGANVLVQVGFRPTGCTPETNCSGLMTTLLSTRDPIADGSILYTCKAAIAPTAALGTTAHLRCSNAQFVQPDEQVGPAACTDGAVVVAEAP